MNVMLCVQYDRPEGYVTLIWVRFQFQQNNFPMRFKQVSLFSATSNRCRKRVFFQNSIQAKEKTFVIKNTLMLVKISTLVIIRVFSFSSYLLKIRFCIQLGILYLFIYIWKKVVQMCHLFLPVINSRTQRVKSRPH